MIVDLIRNDLGKVCHPGTVAVPRHCVLESYSTVHHLASDVRGTLAAGFDAKDAFLALFPGGSITGAPKVAATRLIQQLESRPRGYYTGCLGYFGDDGSSEWNIAIRTLVVQEEQITCHSGGGIVIDSLKEEEYLELLSKIGYLLSPPSSERSAE